MRGAEKKHLFTAFLQIVNNHSILPASLGSAWQICYLSQKIGDWITTETRTSGNQNKYCTGLVFQVGQINTWKWDELSISSGTHGYCRQTKSKPPATDNSAVYSFTASALKLYYPDHKNLIAVPLLRTVGLWVYLT